MALSLQTSALVVALLAETVIVAGLAVSIVWPPHRIWPPGDTSWRFWYYWGSAGVVAGSLSLVATLDTGSFVFVGTVWKTIGGVALLTGSALAGWAARTLRLRESVGIAAGLRTNGPYRYSRNPQLVGIAIAVVGLLLIVNSRLLFLGALPGAAWLVLLPRAEEPWLRAQFGEAYDAYRRAVPRFLGRRSLQRLRR